MVEPDSKRDRHQIVTSKVANFLVLVVTIVWAASFIADISLVDYNPPTQIHTVMLSIVGSIFGFQIINRSK